MSLETGRKEVAIAHPFTVVNTASIGGGKGGRGEGVGRGTEGGRDEDKEGGRGGGTEGGRDEDKTASSSSQEQNHGTYYMLPATLVHLPSPDGHVVGI